MAAQRPVNNVVDIKIKMLETKEQALERLFKAHHTALKAFLRVRLGVREEMEDLAQDVFSRLIQMDDLLEKLPQDNDHARTRAFIFSVANRLVIDMERRNVIWRKYRTEKALSIDSGDVVMNPSPEVELLAKEDLDLVKRVLSKAKPEWRRAFVLNRFKCMSFREIAEEMNVSVKTVEKYTYSVLLSLKEAVLSEKGVTK